MLISLICIGSLLVPFSLADSDCRWKSNITDIDDVAHHKYQVLEECLFYKLTKDADQMQGKSNALMLLPPTVAAGEVLDVQVLHTSLKQMWMNEVFREMNINGHLLLAWKDRRLRWDANEWKTDTLNIKSFGRLWVPDIQSDKHQTAAQSSDYVSFQNIQSNNNGNVTARLEFRMQAHCYADYTEYPSDIKHCCFRLQSTLYKRYIKYFIEHGPDGVQAKIDDSDMRTNWHIEDSHIIKLPEEGDNKSQVLEICLTARRKSTTLAIELTIPVLISALIIIIAPFFGKFNHQIYVKFFALLLQFLSFQYMADKTPQIGFGHTVPKIYIFYAFTLAITVFSILVTVLIAAMSRVKRNMPPAHRFTLLASVLNANLCCGSEEDPVTDGTSSKNISGDWLQIHVALNNIASFVTMLVYIIGVIIIAF